MGKTREIKKRIKAVGNIRRITKTMQMIATAKFSAAQQRSVSSRPYTDALFELVASLAKGLTDIKHPLLSTGPAKPGAKPLMLVLTSDRGLCGPYNGSILRTGMGFVRENPANRAGFIELVGKKGAGFLKYNNIPVSQHHMQFGDKPSYEKVEELAQNYIDRFTSGEVSSVHVIYMKFISAGKQVPTVMQLLPFKADALEKHAPGKTEKAEGSSNVQYEFTPGAEELLGELLPSAVKAVLFQAFNDAIVSEHVARMVAMKAATDNAGKMGKRLTRVYNRARQAQITTELTEIVAGAAALG
ncbi:MAG: ATP synthase F1 subunit gamma [Planctomycetes bacterium]|nr:ATP synthase F1 subunit gamma [Planctomycetota bacterium]